MKADHNWNVLRIMRFYNRIGKPFSAGVYVKFMTPHDAQNVRFRHAPSEELITSILRRYSKNGWCKKVGDNIVITPKGLKTIANHEKQRFEAEKEHRREASVSGGTNRPNERDAEGKYIKGERKRNKYGAFTK